MGGAREDRIRIQLNGFLADVRNAILGELTSILALRNSRSLKDDYSYVTSGDLLINQLIKRLVDKLNFPVSIVSEEGFTASTSNLNDCVIVIDPIDGTENFTSGLPEWGVSVSCFYLKDHVASLVGCPELNLWMQSGMRIEKFQSRIKGLSSSLNKDDLMNILQGHEYRIIGCCVYNMINVIRGSFTSFENPKGAHSWDILAGLNLAIEHNLRVIVDGEKYEGEYLSPSRKYTFRVEHQ